MNPPHSRRAAVAAALAAGLLVSACTSSGGHRAASTTASFAPPPPPPAASSTASAPKPKPAARNPFTGLGPVPKNPTIIAKIDDTAPGRPQVGIDKADIVYIEEAEGGLSRLAAVFATQLPVVGYVRSTRPSDPDLFLQYGRITEAASGGGGDSLPRLRASHIKGWINDWGAAYYARVNRSQSDYINLVLNLKKVAAKVHTPRPRDIGLRFSSSLPVKGAVGTDVKTQVGNTPIEFRWFKMLHKYVRYINGVPQRAADGRLVATPNVIVQVCKIVPHYADRDVLGNPSQFTYTVGTGKVSVFRNGRRIDGYWSRPGLDKGTQFVTTTHRPITLSPGGAWIALVRKRAVTTGR